MRNLRKTTAAIATAALVATPLTLLTATPASAADREFRYAGADVEFDVEKDDGRFEIDVDVDDAKPGSRWRVVLLHDGKRFHNRVHRADSDGEFDIDRKRSNTKGKDRFVLKIKRVGGPKAAKRVIVRR
ncbi:hypothetical protein [Nocardioides massiliensis]|uniref:Uncharacterized protein n=1 Tax=Nocardioides massiliensis TaxID=1325935 RepID=A0ABT9NIV0_9ACTN|nr:hypothetical protein [Nocardioides massiliensis]MDP9820341.1 hypothetical protein [Nocardioides massiliensis]